MNRYLRTLRYSPLTHGIGGLLVALVCAVALFGCKGNTTNNTYTNSSPTALRITVNPAGANVVVTGPGYSQTFTGNQVLTDLAAGQYSAKATYPGFVDAAGSTNVVAGVTSEIQLVLVPTAAIAESPRAVYRDSNGNLIPIDTTTLQSGQFVFYAWLEDNPGGIITSILTSTVTSSLKGDPGMPLLAEQRESAPSFTQNLAGAYVGFKDTTTGVTRPVIGADVRWEIDQQYWGRVNSMQFGTSDDNRIALNYGVFDDQADTRTNNSRLAAERFPLIASDFPLYNQTGIGSPFVDGFTWVTLFSPDAKASARIVAVATINGEEIGKQILYKNFAPQPKIEITKTVDQALINLGTTNTVTWTVTIKNTGTGEATTVSLSDFLASGAGANYSIVPPPGTTPVGDGFTYTFGPIAAPGTPAPPQTAQLLGNAWNYAVLANATVTNTSTAANPTVVNGNVGVSAGSAVTGFPTGIVLNGTIHNNDASAVAAQTALTTAYVDLGARACTKPLNTAITGVLTPGVYCYDSSVTTGTAITLDAQGNPNAEFVFRTGTTLTTPAGTTVTLINGANPCNIYWQLGSAANIGANTFFVGSILAQSSITVGTGSSISGRALARVGAVTLDTNAITAPLSCVAAPGNTQTLVFTATVTTVGTYCNETQVTLYSNGTNTVIPVDLNGKACFTAVAPNLSIVKDFVADDNATSLGKDKTVAVNVPAKLRVRVINNGGGDATGVTVGDLLNGGASAAYRIISLTTGTNTLNSGDGFDTPAFTLVSGGTTTTIFFTVAASADGDYCDTATITAGGSGSDTACLHVRTPNLTITKTDAPSSVLPGGTYTSTIIVTSSGTGTARDVVVSDLLGLNAAANVQAIYVSSSLNNGPGGTLANNTVTANSVVTLVSGGTLTFTVVSRIPLGAVAGSYCDTATVTSSNAVTKQASACVTVPAFSALQTQLVDIGDPVAQGGTVSYSGVLYVEANSNEGVHNNVLTLLYGHTNALNLVTPGVFSVTSMQVYLDTAPVRDPNTGVVVSDPTSPTAVLQRAGTDYTVTTILGKQVITMTPTITLQPNTALYIVASCLVPNGTASGLHTTSYIWDSIGGASATTYQASSSEPTTVLP